MQQFKLLGIPEAHAATWVQVACFVVHLPDLWRFEVMAIWHCFTSVDSFHLGNSVGNSYGSDAALHDKRLASW